MSNLLKNNSQELAKLSRLMLLANFLSTLFYSTSYPYIYAETLKVVSRPYISFENIMGCISVAIFGIIWNKYGDKLFKFYDKIVAAEIVADFILFAHVIKTGDLKFYFLFNIFIYAFITRNMACGGVKMRALVHPDSKLRERYDNNNNTANSLATLIGAITALCYQFDIKLLFIFAFIGNIIDNIFYLYIYRRVKNNVNRAG